jgi:hypothetical protein
MEVRSKLARIDPSRRKAHKEREDGRLVGGCHPREAAISGQNAEIPFSLLTLSSVSPFFNVCTRQAQLYYL